MKYYGDFLVNKTVRCRFNTVNSSGVPTTLTSGAVTVSKDGVDITPTGGSVTLSVDAGSVTGRHTVIIDMSLDGTNFTAGSGYAVRLSGSSAVAGSTVVGIIVGEWSVENRSVIVDDNGRVQVQSGTGAGQISLASGTVSVGAYAAGEDPATLLLATPANKLVTDSSGRIQVQAGTAAGQLDLTSGAIKIQGAIRKNVALAGFQFSMALSLNGLNPDHYTPATGKTVTATRSIDGGAFAACANAVVELANGDYKIDLAGSDLNGSTIMLEFTAAACDTVRYNLVTTP